jgi:hypothetical protein
VPGVAAGGEPALRAADAHSAMPRAATREQPAVPGPGDAGAARLPAVTASIAGEPALPDSGDAGAARLPGVAAALAGKPAVRAAGLRCPAAPEPAVSRRDASVAAAVPAIATFAGEPTVRDADASADRVPAVAAAKPGAAEPAVSDARASAVPAVTAFAGEPAVRRRDATIAPGMPDFAACGESAVRADDRDAHARPLRGREQRRSRRPPRCAAGHARHPRPLQRAVRPERRWTH